MAQRKLVGPESSVRKYDLLTALAVAGMAQSKSVAMTHLRLIALITARYNWKLDEVAIGQEALARLWSVNVRTVKREIKKLVGDGLLEVKRAGARGRVAVYRLSHAKIDDVTGPFWNAVGEDFRLRLEETRRRAERQDERKVLQFPGKGANTVWERTQRDLERKDHARFAAWFAALEEQAYEDCVLVLQAPSGFMASYITTKMIGELTEAVSRNDPELREIVILSPEK